MSIELVLLNGDNDYAYCSDFGVYYTRRSATFSKLGLCSAERNRRRSQSLCARRIKIRGVFSSRQPLWCSPERWLCQFYKHFSLKVVYLDWWLYTGTDSLFAVSTKRNIAIVIQSPFGVQGFVCVLCLIFELLNYQMSCTMMLSLRL